LRLSAGRLTFDVALSTGRDFLPERSFARMLRLTVAAPALVVFNL
jgi:hypothetical protein